MSPPKKAKEPQKRNRFLVRWRHDRNQSVSPNFTGISIRQFSVPAGFFGGSKQHILVRLLAPTGHLIG
jgi:hypothetical protein